MILEVKDIVTLYGQSEVIHGISLSVEAREVVSLLGRNWAGKTTSLRSIMGLTPPRSGNIKFKDIEITKKKPFQIGNLGIGYVPDDRQIFPDLTAEENLELARRLARKNGKRWTIERIYKLFPVLEHLHSSKGTCLSGGEQKMLAIGRALMKNPDLLLLDEPAEGLAPIVVRDLIRVIKEIRETGVTILVADQNLKFCRRIADRGYILDRGLIYYEGGIEEIWQNEEVVRKYLAV
jgi:branched-chain amino acid transport system ATP-binding protein